MRPQSALISCLFLLIASSGRTAFAEEQLSLQLRHQQETSLDSDRFHQLIRQESWQPQQTALIVCDVWDLHHCLNAVRRVEQMAPRLDQVIARAREMGVTIIHAPSSCMDAYKDHPARKRTLDVPAAEKFPEQIRSWCSVIPSEERAVYPIDQSDGGEDDDPEEHAEWAAKLAGMGRNPKGPWKKQSELITINEDTDFIADEGDVVWNILEDKGIRNVILTGVHTNMCVLGRPFGLRQMSRNGKNVVLMRDMTDTMYNPQRWPYVSHFSGTDLIIDHIERYVCPTITSDQIIGGSPFRFAKDTRPHLVMLIAEDEYQTEQTLPAFATSDLRRNFRVTTVFGSDRERHLLPGIEAVRDADVLLVSIRRRWLPTDDMKLVREFVAAGKPVVGIRTASHAFSVRGKSAPDGFADWPEFDAEVFGGNYHGHHGNNLKSTITYAASNDHPVLQNLNTEPFEQGGSLYQTSPLAAGTTVLNSGSITGEPAEPTTWTFRRADGGRSFYTSLGHVKDFANPQFTQLLYNGICWAAGVSPEPGREPDHWSVVEVPVMDDDQLPASVGQVWYRCAFRLPDGTKDARLVLPKDGPIDGWVNGHKLNAVESALDIPAAALEADDTNLLVLRMPAGNQTALTAAPELLIDGDRRQSLAGPWQRRGGSNPAFAQMPLPAKFGAAADVVFTFDEPSWVARPLTTPGQFTAGIEGPACDREGRIYAVNFSDQGTIGRVSPNGSAEVFVRLPEGSIGNGIRFGSPDHFFVADYTQHNILRVDASSRKIATFAHEAGMNQPNDLAITADGTLYASDPNWKASTGQIWRIDTDGSVTRLAKDMGTTNGIEVSPDGRTLYVNESVQRNVWAFDITPERTLTNKRLVKKFPDHGFDGMRCDVDGNLYITRYGAGHVVKMTPAGRILQTIDVLGPRPSNLCFGGPDGRTVYVTEVEAQRLVAFRVDRPGLSWQRLNESPRSTSLDIGRR